MIQVAQDLMGNKAGKTKGVQKNVKITGPSKIISPVTAKGSTPQSRITIPKRKMRGSR